jgi:hypothetical protein
MVNEAFEIFQIQLKRQGVHHASKIPVQNPISVTHEITPPLKKKLKATDRPSMHFAPEILSLILVEQI